jgi:hypothetical protein
MVYRFGGEVVVKKVKKVWDGSQSTAFYNNLDARGQVTQEALGNGMVTERAFEAESGIIQGLTSTFGSSGDVQSLGFTFDLIGNSVAVPEFLHRERLEKRRDEAVEALTEFLCAFLISCGV